MGDEETRVGVPRVDAETALASDTLNVVFIQNLELEAEATGQFLLPLQQHRGRAAHDDLAYFLAQQKLAGDQAGLNGFAQADVIGDEEIYPRQSERLAQWFELVGIEPDTGAERRLEKAWIGGGDAVPSEGVQIGRETLRGIEAAFGQPPPVLAAADLSIEFVLPENIERLALGIIIDTGQAHQRGIAGIGRRLYLLDKVQALPNVDDGARRRAVRGRTSCDHSFDIRTVQDNPLAASARAERGSSRALAIDLTSLE